MGLMHSAARPPLPRRVQCPGGMCVAIAAGLWGAWTVPVPPPPPRVSLFPRATRGACCGLCHPGVPSLCLLVRHSMRSVHSAGSVPLPFGSAPCAGCVCVRSCSCGVRTLPPLISVARAPRAVHGQGAGRAVRPGVCPSAFPATVPCSAYLAQGEEGRWGRTACLSPCPGVACGPGPSRGLGGGGSGAACLSLCLPCTGTKAGLVCVA